MSRRIYGVTVGTPMKPQAVIEKTEQAKQIENNTDNIKEIKKTIEEIKNDTAVKFETDQTLKLENGILSVNTTNAMEGDNTLPITSAGVYATVGNIEALLKTI